VCVCERERERERERRRLERRIRLGSCRNLTALPTGNGVSEGLGQLRTYVRVEETRLLGCCAVWLGNGFTTLRRNVPPSCAGL